MFLPTDDGFAEIGLTGGRFEEQIVSHLIGTKDALEFAEVGEVLAEFLKPGFQESVGGENIDGAVGETLHFSRKAERQASPAAEGLVGKDIEKDLGFVAAGAGEGEGVERLFAGELEHQGRGEAVALDFRVFGVFAGIQACRDKTAAGCDVRVEDGAVAVGKIQICVRRAIPKGARTTVTS